jgi:luciferase family oxidoreductase group 1
VRNEIEPPAVSETPTIPLSVLDLAPITQGSTPGEALERSLDLARHVERLGYRRIWVAEHHNMTGIASAATAVVIGHLAGGTSSIRVGAGGIMLPNHAPLVIAEQFGTLEALYPGRIDLGLGRAPGTDQLTVRALRRDPARVDDFPREVQELQAFLGPVKPGQAVQAVPGGGSEVPLWILGSSTYGAQLAAFLGLPYAFASHFAPDDLLPALEIYRSTFKPSRQLDAPYAMAGVNVFAADTDAEARRLFTSVQLSFASRIRGLPGPTPPPVDDVDEHVTPAEKAAVAERMIHSVVGSPATIREGVESFAALTGADELMVVSNIYDHDARRRSYEILAEAVPH